MLHANKDEDSTEHKQAATTKGQIPSTRFCSGNSGTEHGRVIDGYAQPLYRIVGPPTTLPTRYLAAHGDAAQSDTEAEDA
jgi:hypothetical protein